MLLVQHPVLQLFQLGSAMWTIRGEKRIKYIGLRTYIDAENLNTWLGKTWKMKRCWPAWNQWIKWKMKSEKWCWPAWSYLSVCWQVSRFAASSCWTENQQYIWGSFVRKSWLGLLYFHVEVCSFRLLNWQWIC